MKTLLTGNNNFHTSRFLLQHEKVPHEIVLSHAPINPIRNPNPKSVEDQTARHKELIEELLVAELEKKEMRLMPGG